MATQTAARSKPATDTPVTPPRAKSRGLPRWILYAVGGVLGLGVCVGVAFYVTRPEEIPESFKLQQALKYLENDRLAAAHAIAISLQQTGYIDPDFPGGVDFILGIISFHEAQDQDEISREQSYVVTTAFLKQADKYSVPKEWEPQWAWALGVSLFRSGSVEESIPLLRQGIDYPPGKLEAGIYLIDAYLAAHEPQSTKLAVELSTRLVTDPDLSPERRDEAWLEHAQALIMSGRKTEAEAALKNVAPSALTEQGKAVLRAQVFMVEGNYTEALKLLEPVATSDGYQRTYPSRASYLRGKCAVLLSEQIRNSQSPTDPARRQADLKGWMENAVTYFERTAESFEGTQEAVASQLGAADALRALDRREEALQTYGTVLRGIRKPEHFRNRWVSLKKVEERVLAAWEAWIAQGRFPEAIALAELMPPVIRRDQASDLVAQGHERWAEHLQSEYDKLPTPAKVVRRGELLNRWKRCGEAFAKAAMHRTTGYDDAVAKSADYLLKGHDFAESVVQWTTIVENQPPQWISTALLHRGQAYLDLNQPKLAIADFQRLIATYPTDPNSYQAQYYLGRGFIERNQLDEAETAWRQLLTTNVVEPNSEEWRLTVFELAQLLQHRAEQELRDTRDLPLSTAGVPERREAAFRRLDEVLQKLDEYLRRYPQSEEAIEAQFHLGRSFQLVSERPADKYKTAVTDNARAEYEKQRKSLLEQAVGQLRPLQVRLVDAQRTSEMSPARQTLLRTCSFELAHCLFALGANRPAIEAYQFCVARYQQDAEALLALIQMANCYQRLKQPAEAVSTLTQAQLMLKQLPESAFPARPGSLSRDEWVKWLEWAVTNQQL